MTLNDKILKCIVKNTGGRLHYVVTGDATAKKFSMEIEKLILQEQIDLLKNFYYGEDLKDDEILDFYKRVLKIAKEDLTKRLTELKAL